MKLFFFLLLSLAFAQISFGQNIDGSSLRVERKITKEKNRYLVELTIFNNSKLSGFVKVQEIIPKNFIAEEKKSAKAVFSFVGGKVKYVWMGFPSEGIVKISYHLKWTGRKGIDIPDINNISGEFSFLTNNETKKLLKKAVRYIRIAEKMMEKNQDGRKISRFTDKFIKSIEKYITQKGNRQIDAYAAELLIEDLEYIRTNFNN